MAGMGILAAYGMSIIRIRTRTTAWIMPATGVRPPFLHWPRYGRWRLKPDAAKKGGSDISGALGRQFHIRTVFSIDHAVCYHTGEQRLNGRQDSDGKSVRKGSLDHFKA